MSVLIIEGSIYITCPKCRRPYTPDRLAEVEPGIIGYACPRCEADAPTVKE